MAEEPKSVGDISFMKVREGDLIQLAIKGYFDVIVHGCNCQCKMGAGIAKAIKEAFPEAYEKDLTTIKGSVEKLGSISWVEVNRDELKIIVVNGYTQLDWKGKGVKLDYDAIRIVMKNVRQCFSGKRIGYPLIGAGLAGGDWNKIAKIIDEELSGEDHTLVKFVNQTSLNSFSN